jgi:hypothetical protein
MRPPLLLIAVVATGLAQQPTDRSLDKPARAAVVEALAAKLKTGYVLPDSSPGIIQALQGAQEAGDYTAVQTPKEFAEMLTKTLRTASHDKHLSVFFDPLPPPSSSQASSKPSDSRERYNFGFGKLERLRGNVGYLEILSFAPVEQAAETGGAFLSALANFDAIILDLRKNGGGNTPMVAFVASYFFNVNPVHLTDIYWRDSNETSQFWTWPLVPGRRSARQPLYILTSGSTFSSAEDFCYSLQKLKRAVIVGERTGGGAHSGRGLQRLTPLFTAFIPVGRSVSPITKSNWEGVGVEPDFKKTADRALDEAHVQALKVLLERETDERWQQNLQRTLQDLTTKQLP